MDEDIPLPFDLPERRLRRRRITSDGGVMLLAQAERRLGIAERPAVMLDEVYPRSADFFLSQMIIPEVPTLS